VPWSARSKTTDGSAAENLVALVELLLGTSAMPCPFVGRRLLEARSRARGSTIEGRKGAPHSHADALT